MKKEKQKIIRMNLRTYVKLRKNFPAYENESAAEYFERLSIKLDIGDY